MSRRGRWAPPDGRPLLDAARGESAVTGQALAEIAPPSVLRLLCGLLGGCLPAVAALIGLLPGATAALTPPLIFALVLWMWPASRPEARPPVSPKNLLLAGFAIQLVVAPLLFLAVGPVPWVFPVRQTWGAIGQAALLIGLSFPCWVLGLALVERMMRDPRPSGPALRVSARFIMVSVALGVAGLALLAWQADTGSLPDAPTGEGGGVVQVLRLLLRPFLAMAGVAILSNVLLARPGGREPAIAIGMALVLIVVSHATLDVRRAPLLASLLALVAAYALVTGRPPVRTLVSFGVAATAAFLAIRVLRSPHSPVAALFSSTATEQSLVEALNTEVQSYAGGIQMVAFMLDHFDVFGGYLGGRGQLYAALSPVPSLGASVRDAAPGALYNALFLNRSDQVLPMAGQFYFDFGPAAVAVGFTVLGGLTAGLNQAFLRSRTLVEGFIWSTPAAWLAFSLGSGPGGFYQSLIYFSAPAYALLVVFARQRRRRPED